MLLYLRTKIIIKITKGPNLLRTKFSLTITKCLKYKFNISKIQKRLFVQYRHRTFFALSWWLKGNFFISMLKTPLSLSQRLKGKVCVWKRQNQRLLVYYRAKSLLNISRRVWNINFVSQSAKSIISIISMLRPSLTWLWGLKGRFSVSQGQIYWFITWAKAQLTLLCRRKDNFTGSRAPKASFNSSQS